MSQAADVTGEGADPRSDEELKAVLASRTSGMAALGRGLGLAGRTAATGLPLALAYALVNGAVGWWLLGIVERLEALEPATLELMFQVGLGLSVFLGLYTGVQFTKRHTASRASWAPSLFAAPLLLATGGLWMISAGQYAQIGPVVLSLFLIPWWLLWGSFGGAMTAIGWVRAGHDSLEGRSSSFGAIVDEIRRRTVEVAGPHGGRVQAVTIGMQVLVPGIFYALQLAFTDMVAVLEPDRAALKRSGLLTWGMRGRLFRLLLVWFVVTYAVAFGLGVALEGSTEPMIAAFIDPGAVSAPTFFATELIWGVTYWVLELALLVLYVEREGQVAAKRELKRRKKAESYGAFQSE